MNSKFILKFTYVFQILGSNIHFQKIPKSNHTINFYPEFSCKSRFAKVFFAITSHFWTPNLTFCFLAIKNKDISNIYLTQKLPFSIKYKKYNLLNWLKNRKQKQKKQDTSKKTEDFA